MESFKPRQGGVGGSEGWIWRVDEFLKSRETGSGQINRDSSFPFPSKQVTTAPRENPFGFGNCALHKRTTKNRLSTPVTVSEDGPDGIRDPDPDQREWSEPQPVLVKLPGRLLHPSGLGRLGVPTVKSLVGEVIPDALQDPHVRGLVPDGLDSLAETVVLQ